jgi:hypothetical protein
VCLPGRQDATETDPLPPAQPALSLTAVPEKGGWGGRPPSAVRFAAVRLPGVGEPMATEARRGWRSLFIRHEREGDDGRGQG